MKLFTRPNMLRVIMACAIAVALIVLDGIWLNTLDPEFEAKLMVTLGVIAAAAALAYVISSNIADDTKLKNDKYLN